MDSLWNTKGVRLDIIPFQRQNQKEIMAFFHLNQEWDRFCMHSCDDQNAFEI